MIAALRQQLATAIEPYANRLRDAWLPRYRQLESREQRILMIAAIVLPLLLLVFGLLLPLADRQKTLRAELAQVYAERVEATALAKLLLSRVASGQQRGAASQSLLTQVELQARQTGVRSFMTRLKPQASPTGSGKQLIIQMKSAPYKETLKFMYALAGMQVGVKSFDLQPADKPGYVNVRAIISGR